MADLLKSLIKFSDPKQAGKALLWLNVFSTALAAATNTIAAAVDKNTSPEDKKFLVPAGIVTGFANIGLYLALTLKVIDKMEKKAEQAIGHMLKKGNFADNSKKFVDHIIDKAKNKDYHTDMVSYLNSAAKDNKVTELKESFKTIAQDKGFQGLLEKGITNGQAQYMETIKGCASVAGAFVGVIVGCGILSPIIRDVSAYFVQKHMEKKNPKYKDAPYRPYFDPGHFKVGYTTTKQPLNINNYMAFTRAKALQNSSATKI